MTIRTLAAATFVTVLGLSTGRCATLNQLVQPPQFSVAQGRDTQLRLLGPSTSRPLGGASLRIWARSTFRWGCH